MNVVLIPARGGSKGVPRKNIRTIGGKPLIVWSIEQGLSASTVASVYVSTDDDEIARVARAAGADVIMRPTELSGDEATTESAISHFLSQLGYQQCLPDNIILLQCTSPIRPAGSIDAAFDHFRDHGADSLLSVSPNHRFLWKLNDEGFGVPENYDPHQRPRRQDIRDSFQENGSIYIFSRDCFERFGNRLGGKIVLYNMPDEASQEIDTVTDFFIVEALMKKIGVC